VSPSNGEAFHKLTAAESGNSTDPQLCNLKQDIGEINNLAEKYPGN
jgi:hypothetical protein